MISFLLSWLYQTAGPGDHSKSHPAALLFQHGNQRRVAHPCCRQAVNRHYHVATPRTTQGDGSARRLRIRNQRERQNMSSSNGYTQNFSRSENEKYILTWIQKSSEFLTMLKVNVKYDLTKKCNVLFYSFIGKEKNRIFQNFNVTDKV